MAKVRYYTEELDGRIDHMVVQDETGTYTVYENEGAHNGDGLLAVPYTTEERMPVKLPDWKDAREVSTASRDYLEYIRVFERSSYMWTIPSEIREMEGTIEDAVHHAWIKGVRVRAIKITV